MADVGRREPKAAPLEVDEADLAAAARCASDEEVGRLWVAVSARAPQDSEGVTWRVFASGFETLTRRMRT